MTVPIGALSDDGEKTSFPSCPTVTFSVAVALLSGPVALAVQVAWGFAVREALPAQGKCGASMPRTSWPSLIAPLGVEIETAVRLPIEDAAIQVVEASKRIIRAARREV